MSQEWEVSLPDPAHPHSAEAATAACDNTATARRSWAAAYTKLSALPPRRQDLTTRPPRATVPRPIPRPRVTGVPAPLAALESVSRTARYRARNGRRCASAGRVSGSPVRLRRVTKSYSTRTVGASLNLCPRRSHGRFRQATIRFLRTSSKGGLTFHFLICPRWVLAV